MTLKEYVDNLKRHYVLQQLEALQWDFDLVAQSLGISRKSLWELRKRYGLVREQPTR